MMNYSDETADESAHLQDEMDRLNLWDLEQQVEMAMEALGCPPKDADVTTLSGGERRRIALCQLLLRQPDLLLLDEPTNDLDTETLAALEDALESFAGCAVIISHDRMFLDRMATHMLAFEGDSHVEWFEGNFEDYEADKVRRLGPEALNPHKMTYKRLTR
jgi:ATPase subunit of ABC transporter with duplicated ATPase domains